jgi:NADPH2:quinone reductase
MMRAGASGMTNDHSLSASAWRIRRFGEPQEVLEEGTVSFEQVDGDDVLIAVEAIGLNFLDVSVCRGAYGANVVLPLTPGAEVTGRVLEVGPDVKSIAVSDRVSALSPTARGGFAQAVALPESAVCLIPDELPAEDAASLLVTYHTAHVSLVRRANVRAGEWVLVHAGAGGTGSAAIQIAVSCGANVIATSRSAEKAEVMRTLGAHVAINSAQEDFVDVVMEATAGKGADVILDPVGGETFRRSLDCIAFEGRLIPVGWASGVPSQLDLLQVLQRNITVIGVSWGAVYPTRAPEVVQETHKQILQGWEAGALRPLVRQIAPFSELPSALQALADGSVTGKAVVRLEAPLEA